MRTITASEARHSFANVLKAAAHGPVTIQNHKQDMVVIMSMQEYERLVHLNRAEFQRFCDQVGAASEKAGMTEEKLARLLSSEE